MDIHTLTAWIASIPGIGPKRFESLEGVFSDLHDLFTLSKQTLIERGVPQKLAASIAKHRSLHAPESIAAYCHTHGILILIKEDVLYPSLLKEIADPPLVLYVKGKLPDETFPKIGVVGTRQITSYGEEVTHTLTADLVDAGFVIVSGFMYGVDACAHRTALKLDGKTIGVLGFGFEHMYPREHELLAYEMIKSGNCLITEFPPWQSPVPGNFPARNRIVSGLSLGILVTEAASKSGSKITARLAGEQGREVFAVPGPIYSPFSEGTKELVNMGAKLVTNIQDITQELMT